MTDRELLELLLTKLTTMESKFTTMESKLTTMESKFTTMESKLTSTESKLATVESKLTTVESDIKELKIDLRSVTNQTAILTEFRDETYARFDSLEDKIDDLEANNADRHISLNGELKKIKTGLSKIEIVTADNWGDIARIKAAHRNKVK